MDGFVSYDTLLGKLLLISIAVFVLWISYLMGTIIRIYHVRRRMRDYRRFVRSTYVRFGNPVPPMIMRYFSKRWKPTIKCGTFGLCADFIRRFRLKESSILPLRLPVRGTFRGRRGSRSFRMKNASSPVKLTIWKNIPFYHIGSRLPPLLMRLNASGRLVQYGPINRLVVGEEI